MGKARLEVYKGEKKKRNQMITYPLTQRMELQIPRLSLEGPGAGHCKQSSKACGWKCRVCGTRADVDLGCC